MKIYTKTGDEGKTSLIGGARVPKSHLRIDGYGTIDELNSYIGLVRSQEITEHQKEILKEVQNNLFVIGSLLAADPEKSKMVLPELQPDDIALLEKEIDLMQRELPELKNFILPGGPPLVSFFHIARCVCRRAERIVVELSQESFVSGIILMYLNRLSDYLFVLARKVSLDNNIEEINWLPRGK